MNSFSSLRPYYGGGWIYPRPLPITAVPAFVQNHPGASLKNGSHLMRFDRLPIFTPVSSFLAILLTLALLGPSSAFATSAMPNNLAELVDGSGKAFVATVVEQKVIPVGEGWGERITVEVHEALRGTQDGDKLTWTQYRLGQETRLPGMPQYEVGRTYLIFLRDSAPGSPFTAPVGLGQGVFVIATSSTGVIRARNQFNNAHIYAGLDLKQLGPAAAPQRAAIKLKSGSEAGSQTELATLVAQARALNAVPGRNSVSRFGRMAREVVPLGLSDSSSTSSQLSTAVR